MVMAVEELLDHVNLATMRADRGQWAGPGLGAR
jgi:hypothetical protein